MDQQVPTIFTNVNNYAPQIIDENNGLPLPSSNTPTYYCTAIYQHLIKSTMRTSA